MLTKARYLLLGTALLLSACATTPSLSQTTPVSTPAQSVSPTPRPTPVEALTPTPQVGRRTAAEWYALLEEAGYGDARAIVHRRLAEVWDASVASPAFQWQVRKLNARINLLPFIAAKHLENGQTIDDVEEFYMNAPLQLWGRILRSVLGHDRRREELNSPGRAFRSQLSLVRHSAIVDFVR